MLDQLLVIVLAIHLQRIVHGLIDVPITVSDWLLTIQSFIAITMKHLKKGSSGEAVQDLQGQLHRLRFDPGPLDGDFGPKTRKAVIAFQKRYGLDPDGIVGPLTRRALNKALKDFARDKDKKRPSGLVINRSLQLRSGQYFKAEHKKDLIVLHHTAGGSAKSTLNWWNQDSRRIATPFIIGRDGTIYEVFDPRKWAYHLGLRGTGGRVDRRSIGIEIASEGGLKESQGKLYKFDRVLASTLFTGKSYRHPSSWRGYQHYAEYTKEQVSSVIHLTDYLLQAFDIPRRTPANHLDFNKGLYSFKGVLGHHHLRPDKSDLHPGFNWEKLIQGTELKQV